MSGHEANTTKIRKPGNSEARGGKKILKLRSLSSYAKKNSRLPMSAGTAIMPPPSHVFEPGGQTVRLLHVDPESMRASDASPPPPKPLLIAHPWEEGEYPTLVFLHGYLLYNSFYSQLIQHVASHGFIVVAPQLYNVAGPDSTEEIKSVATIADWLTVGLLHALPKHVRANLSSIGLAGHSRGGKVAFALALGHAKTTVKFSALIGIDPVDGMDKGKQTNPPILTYVPRSFDIKMASLVVGSGFGGLKKNPLFPPCAPNGVSHQDFFNECCYPACYFVARNHGHLDMLDDDTKGLRGKATYCLCKNGKSRKPMRIFVGGVIVAFMKAYMEGDVQDLMALKDDPKIAPVELSRVAFLEEEPS